MTAVQWLFSKLWDEPKDKFTWYALREKAKQMEQEQMIIPDEEIEEAIHRIYGRDCEDFYAGAEWYREQLKLRQ